MIVYHGSILVVDKPDVDHSFRPLDFGRGFYVTTVREQAERWAKRKAALLESDKAIINVFEMNENNDGLKVKTFAEDLTEWIDFVCECRDGKTEYEKYDQIAFVTQKAIDQLLVFQSFREV